MQAANGGGCTAAQGGERDRQEAATEGESHFFFLLCHVRDRQLGVLSPSVCVCVCWPDWDQTKANKTKVAGKFGSVAWFAPKFRWLASHLFQLVVPAQQPHQGLSKSNQKYQASTPLASLPFHLTSPATLSGLSGRSPRWSCCELASSSIM